MPTESLEPLQAFLGVFCSRWSLLVLAALAPHEMGCGCASASAIEYSKPSALRRNALEKRLPHISRKVLTETLRRLEQAGLVEKTVIAEVPARVEYSLTSQGQRFLKPLSALQSWCGLNQDVLQLALDGLPETLKSIGVGLVAFYVC